MSRPLRPQYPGAIYHVMSRGNGKQEIFLDDVDRKRFLRLLERVTKDMRWHCFSYCLMDNHFHLMLETPEPNLSIGMHRLNSGYSTGFMKRHGRVGHVMQGRFHSPVIEHDAHFLEVFRYIAGNPAAAGMVEKPEAWEWGSYRAVMGIVTPPVFIDDRCVLEMFSGDPTEARRQLSRFVQEGLESDYSLPYVGTAVVGDMASAPGTLKAIESARKDSSFAHLDRYADRPPIDRILNGTEVDRRWRNRMIRAAHNRYGYTIREIADFIGLNPSTVKRALSN